MRAACAPPHVGYERSGQRSRSCTSLDSVCLVFFYLIFDVFAFCQTCRRRWSDAVVAVPRPWWLPAWAEHGGLSAHARALDSAETVRLVMRVVTGVGGGSRGGDAWPAL